MLYFHRLSVFNVKKIWYTHICVDAAYLFACRSGVKFRPSWSYSRTTVVKTIIVNDIFRTLYKKFITVYKNPVTGSTVYGINRYSSVFCAAENNTRDADLRLSFLSSPSSPFCILFVKYYRVFRFRI